MPSPAASATPDFAASATSTPAGPAGAGIAQAPRPAGIALDWGTTNLRAFLLDDAGGILAQREKPWGILSLPAPADAGGFDAALEGIAGDWLADRQLPLIASGMVGSAQGWREAPYVDCPAGAAELAARVVPVATARGRELLLVPGILSNLPDALPDVIRGEETQVFGALASLPTAAPAACFVLPGTHSKWVLVRDGRIILFATYMTGEVYATLTQHSILGRLMPTTKEAGQDVAARTAAADETDNGAGAAAYLQALDLARASAPGDLMRHLFTARSMKLAGRLPASALADYLSGLLIGHELVSASAWLARNIGQAAPIVLIGEARLLARYRAAMPRFGLEATSLPNTAAAGLHHLLGLVGGSGSRSNANL